MSEDLGNYWETDGWLGRGELNLTPRAWVMAAWCHDPGWVLMIVRNEWGDHTLIQATLPDRVSGHSLSVLAHPDGTCGPPLCKVHDTEGNGALITAAQWLDALDENGLRFQWRF